jgi:hypothetical protein
MIQASAAYRLFIDAGSIVADSQIELCPVINELSLDLACGSMTEGVGQCFASDAVYLGANEWFERHNCSYKK